MTDVIRKNLLDSCHMAAKDATHTGKFFSHYMQH